MPHQSPPSQQTPIKQRYRELASTSPEARWRRALHTVIFEAETPGGKLFDVLLILSILASVVVVMLDSIAPIHAEIGRELATAEWVFTILFSIEYVLRLACVVRPLRYARSFFGLIDLLAILPTYLSVMLPGSRYLTVIRILRVLRVFRVLKLVPYLNEADFLMTALRASTRKIAVFIFTVVTLVVVMGSLMYVIEGEANGFSSIPVSIYWCIVTLTTVGYGDISPQTALGQSLASFIMILGYGIIAVPTGIVSAEMTKAQFRPVSARVCRSCTAEGHDPAASYCNQCGAKL